MILLIIAFVYEFLFDDHLRSTFCYPLSIWLSYVYTLPSELLQCELINKTMQQLVRPH